MADDVASITIQAQNEASATLQQVADDLGRVDNAARSAAGGSMSALQEQSKSLYESLKTLSPASAEFAATSTQYQAVKSELDKVKEAANGVGKAHNEMLQGMKDGLREIAPQIGRFGDGMAIAMGAGIAASYELVKSSLEVAISLEGVNNRARAIFGETLPRMNEATERLSVTLHRSASDLLNFSTGFATLYQGAGLAGPVVNDLSLKMAELSVNLGKVYPDLSDDQVYEKLAAAVRGSAKALQELKIPMNEHILQKFAETEGIKLNVSHMDDEQLMYLRTQFLLHETKKFQDEAAKSTGDLGDSAKSLGAQWHDMLEEVGTDIGPAASSFASAIVSATTQANNALSSLKQGFVDVFLLIKTGGNATMSPDGYMVTNVDRAGFAERDAALTKERESLEKAGEATKSLADEQKKGGVAAGFWTDHSDAAGQSAQKLQEELKGLADQYTTVGDRIKNSLDSLEASHINKMASLDHSIRTAMDGIRNLGQTYQREMDKINETKLDKVANQMGDIQKLKDKVSNDSVNGLSQDQLANSYVSWKENRTDKNSQVATERDAMSMGMDVSGSEGKKALAQLNDFIKLQTQQGALTDYTKSHPEVDTKKAGVLSQETGFTREMAKVDEDKGQKDADYQKSQQQKQEEIKVLQAKRNEELTAYSSARAQYLQTQTAFTTFHNDYVTKINNMASVTKQAVDKMKEDLKSLSTMLASVKPSSSLAGATTGAVARTLQLETQY